MLEKQLEKLGFAKNEIAVYLALFELGKVRAGEIITHTKLHRNLVYQSLEKLIEKELVTRVLSKGVAMFEAHSPDALVLRIEEQKNIAEQISKELKKRQGEKPREIVVYEGYEGVKRSRNRALQYKPGDTLYVIGSKASSSPEMEKYWRQFHRKREEKGINLKLLYEHGVDPRDVAWRNQLKHSEAKYLPLDMDLPVWFAFIKDYLEIGIAGENPLTFGITSTEAVGAFENFFRYFWNQKASTETGNEALHKTLYGMMNELNSGEEYYVLGGTYGMYAENTRDFYLEYHEKRIAKGVVVNILGEANMIKEYKNYFKGLDPSVTRLKEFISPLPQPFQINLFRGKTKMIIYSKEPTIISFESKEVYDGFKTYFDALWNQETQMLRGPEVVKNIWLESIELGEIRLIGARGYFIDRYPKLFEEVKRAAEKKKGLKWKNVVDPSARNHPLNKFPWTEARYNLTGSKNPNVVWMWGNKVAVANWTEDEPVVFISENKHLVQSYNDYFEELWNLKQKN